MLSTVTVTTAPEIEPVSIDQVRRHCRIDSQSEDDLLQGYLRAARALAEQYLSQALITQTLTWTVTPTNPLRPWWHRQRGALELPRAPVQSIASVTALDARGNVTTILPASLPVVPPATLLGYRADLAHSPARLLIGEQTIMSDGRAFHTVELEYLQVVFAAGYGDTEASVPEQIRQAILMTTAFIDENRGDVAAEMPKAAQWLLDPLRLRWVA